MELLIGLIIKMTSVFLRQERKKTEQGMDQVFVSACVCLERLSREEATERQGWDGARLIQLD